MKSSTLPIYKEWLKSATQSQIEFVDSVFLMCEQNYANGGDTICECYEPSEIIEEFTSLDDVKEFCGLKVEQALNARWGEDSDPEFARSKRFEEWE